MLPVTMVVTSFGRHDLLESTLSSFFSVNDYPLRRILISEDGNDRRVYDVVSKFPGQPIEVLLHGEHLGQLASIDKAYASIDTEYVFHCEDDWKFGRAGIVRESLRILELDPEILMVLPRDKSDLPYYLTSVPIREIQGARYRKTGPKLHHLWYTFSFNPGLRRLSDYRLLPNGYSAFRLEVDISAFYKARGRAMAILEDGQVSHIGAGRSTVPVPKSFFDLSHQIGKLSRSVRRRSRHYLRLLGIGDGSE